MVPPPHTHQVRRDMDVMLSAPPKRTGDESMERDTSTVMDSAIGDESVMFPVYRPEK
jgi:hypothetical protein